MLSFVDLLIATVSDVFREVFSEREIEDCLPVEVSQTTCDKFGHYQCNAPMKLAKVLRLSPQAIASQVQAPLKQALHAMISDLTIAPPGFINITLSTSCLEDRLKYLWQDPRLGVEATSPKKIIIDLSSPNVAKELHVGHLRSTVIGEALARLYTFLGHRVVRLNHVGDWGTQFGMLIAFIKQRHPEFVEGRQAAALSDLMHWYRESKKYFDQDAEFKKRAQAEVVKLQQKEGASLDLWHRICHISRLAFQEVYDLLDVTLEERGESFYNAYLPPLIEELERKGLLTLSDGAKCIFLEGFQGKDGNPLPMIVQKADGGFNYATTDMAAIRHRALEEKADAIFYVVDAGQALHLQMVFKAARLAGFYSASDVRVEHVAFGVVLGSDGKKFKTRSGDTERLIDLLREGVKRARAILEKRLPGLSEKEIEEQAKILGIGALKYADLSGLRIKDYIFNYDKMLCFEGNTAPYLLYSYVRIQGVKRKVNKGVIKPLPLLTHPKEVDLALHLCRFSESLSAMDRELAPNRLADYLYVLAKRFHSFYQECRIEGDTHQESRLMLCELSRRILQQGLNILGIKTLEKM